MKNILTLTLVILLSFVLGCGNKSDETGKKDTKDVKKDEKKTEFVSGFACKIDGKDFVINEPDSYAKKDAKSFSIYAKIEVQNGQYDDFFFYIESPLQTGDFALSKENKPGHVQYRTNQWISDKTLFDQFWTDAGKLTITKVDDKNLEGTFNFTATGTVNDVEKKLNITDGKLKIKIQ
jgi:hypothetical protein